MAPNGTAVASSSPVIEPKGAKWTAPVTVVQAKDSARIRDSGQKAVITYEIPGRVTKVGDGDGAEIQPKNGGELLKCRIDAIDAPETAKPWVGKVGQPFGEESKKSLQDMILNKEVTVRVTRAPTAKEGKDSRSYCKIALEGKDVSLSRVQAGAAWVYTRYSQDPELATAQQDAQEAKRGLFKGTNPEYPEDFRRRMGY